MTPEFAERQTRRHCSDCEPLWAMLDEVYDPEIPTLTIYDLGILQDIRESDEAIDVDIILTYSGCPAIDLIKENIEKALRSGGIEKAINIKTCLSPAWSTDMLSPKGIEQLKANQIAPPDDHPGSEAIECPNCGAGTEELISQFGSTSCKALYRCSSCQEPFDYFKPF